MAALLGWYGHGQACSLYCEGCYYRKYASDFVPRCFCHTYTHNHTTLIVYIHSVIRCPGFFLFSLLHCTVVILPLMAPMFVHKYSILCRASANILSAMCTAACFASLLISSTYTLFLLNEDRQKHSFYHGCTLEGLVGQRTLVGWFHQQRRGDCEGSKPLITLSTQAGLTEV